MKKLATLTAISLLATPAIAHAAPPGWYLQAGAGLSFLEDTDVGAFNDGLEFDTGYVGSFSGGYHFANGIRTELELGYRANGNDKANITPTGGVDIDGHTDAETIMVNALYELPTNSAFSPYIGVGAGVAHLTYNSDNFQATSSADEGNETAFAMQGIAGVNYQFKDRYSAFVDYRYLTAFDAGLDLESTNGNTLDIDYNNHAVLVGLRYSM